MAEWILDRLPFRWAPIWLNNRLARWAWDEVEPPKNKSRRRE